MTSSIQSTPVPPVKQRSPWHVTVRLLAMSRDVQALIKALQDREPTQSYELLAQGSIHL